MAVHQQAAFLSWDQPCSDDHLSLISEWIPDWREMATFLGLISQEEELGYQDSAPTPQTGMAMLKAWKEKHGPAATYSRLTDAFRQCGRQDLVERVSRLLVAADRSETSSSIGQELVFQCCMIMHWDR